MVCNEKWKRRSPFVSLKILAHKNSHTTKSIFICKYHQQKIIKNDGGDFDSLSFYYIYLQYLSREEGKDICKDDRKVHNTNFFLGENSFVWMQRPESNLSNNRKSKPKTYWSIKFSTNSPIPTNLFSMPSPHSFHVEHNV